jgi:hypothetical protein
MVSICNICNLNIDNNAYYLFDKIHCSIICKNIYKRIMEKKNLGPNELYYEREYHNLKKNRKIYPLIYTNNNMEKNENKLSDITNVLKNKKVQKENNELKEIVIHKSINCESKEKKGYLDIIKNISFNCLRYFTK